MADCLTLVNNCLIVSVYKTSERRENKSLNDFFNLTNCLKDAQKSFNLLIISRFCLKKRLLGYLNSFHFCQSIVAALLDTTNDSSELNDEILTPIYQLWIYGSVTKTSQTHEVKGRGKIVETESQTLRTSNHSPSSSSLKL